MLKNEVKNTAVQESAVQNLLKKYGFSDVSII